MELDVWIEFDKAQQKNWEGGDWAKDVVGGTLAETRSPFFPYGHKAFDKVKELISSKKYKSERIDALTEYVLVPKSMVLEVVNGLHGGIDHLDLRLDELKEHVKKLPDFGKYKLVCQEF